MRRTILALSLVAAAPLTTAFAGSQPPPAWDVSQACPGQALSGSCPRFESEARRSLLDRWSAVSVDIRAACLQQAEARQDHSFRNLATCISERAAEAFESERMKQSQASH